MRIEVVLQSLKTTNESLRRGFLKIHFDDHFKIQSAQIISRHGSCYMMEKNIIQMEQSRIPNTISFDFVSDGNVQARICLFRNEALSNQNVVLKPTKNQDKNTYTLHYSLKIIQNIDKNGSQQQVQVKSPSKNNPLDEGANSLPDVKQSLKYLQLGKVTYLFSKRLGPVLVMNNLIQGILFWKNPLITVVLGAFLTSFIFFPIICIFLITLCLLFARKHIINYIQNALQKQINDERLLVPQQNLKFLKDFMQLYCNIYEKVSDFLKNDDRTKIIAILELICKCAVFLFVFSLIFSFQTFLATAVWVALLSTTQTGLKILRIMMPQLLNFNRQFNKILKNVAKNHLSKVINSGSNITVMKEFYIYEHQRWWLGIQWSKSRWSDQKGQQQLQIRIDLPQGWKWITDWKIEYNQNSDKDGYQYANGIIDIYNPQFGKKSINSIRRRKWKRLSCTVEQKMIEQLRMSKDHDKSSAKIAGQTQILSPNNTPTKSSKVKFK